jgi:putative CocE/NonD family hydrolase
VTFASWVFARAAKLPRASAADVVVERDVETKMGDGVVLLSDRWYSPSTVRSAPVVLLRSPYGRRQFGIFGRLFSERGYQVVIQSCRGTFGSGGRLEPFLHETPDGAATVEWIASQPWFTGKIGMFGPSYLGLVQWALAGRPPAELQAMALQVTASNVRDAVVFPGGSFSLETGAVWVQQMVYQENTARYLWALATSKKRLARAYRTLPLRRADLAAHGLSVDYYQQWLDHSEPGDPWWDEIDWSGYLSNMPRSSHVAGWYDIFLPSQIDDFCRQRAAGRDTRITVGPWSHMSPGGGTEGLRDALELFDDQLLGRSSVQPRGRVRLFVMGADRWVDLPGWPPPARTERWHLHPGNRLSPDAPEAAPPDTYRYDPADPTPSLSGATLDPLRAGAKDQRRREGRADVLVYSSSVLRRDLTVAGPVAADIFMRSSRPHFDVFVRLCEVDAKGRSRNVCDGIQRVQPTSIARDQDGVSRVRVRMWPTARTFRTGHRIRLQVSSAAHPLFARNPGSGEALGSASHLFPSEHEVFHDPDRPSAIELPISDI